MDFGALFSRAARITWEHKILWLFGFIISLFGGGYSASANFQGFGGFNPEMQPGEVPINPETGMPDLRSLFPFLPRDFDPSKLSGGDIGAIFGALGGVLLLIVAGALVLSLLFALIEWFGRGALIKLVDDVDAGRGTPTASQGINAGLRHFLRLFVIALLLMLPAVVIGGAGLLIFGAGLVSFILSALTGDMQTLNPMGLLGSLGCLFPLICLAVLIAWFTGLWRNLAVNAAVIEDLGIMDSLRRSWKLLLAHIGEVLILWIVLALIGLIFSFLVGLPGIAIGLPAFWRLASGQLSQGLLGATLLLACVYGLVVAALSGLLVTFVSAAWTLAYRQFAGLNMAGAGTAASAGEVA